MVGETARRGEVEKLVNKFIRLVSNEPENGWEKDGDALSKDSFALYMEEYRDTFEGALRLTACVNNDALEGQLLFDAVYDSIDWSRSDAITKAQFRDYFLVSKARELGLIEVKESPESEGDDDECYGDDTFDESPRPPLRSPMIAGGDNADSADDEGYGDDDFETSQSPATSPIARAAVAQINIHNFSALNPKTEMRRGEVEKLVNKFIRLVANEPENGWEEDGDALSKDSFALYMEEYRDTFEEGLRLSSCVNDDALEGQLLFDAVYDSIDSNGTDSITKAQFREYFLATKARELGLNEVNESPGGAGDEDEGYGDDIFDESPRPPLHSPLGGSGPADSADDEGYGDDDFETSQSPAASPLARATVPRVDLPRIPALNLPSDGRRGEVEKLVNKFVRLVSNESESGWEEDCDALSKESFVLYMEEYRDTFEVVLRLPACVSDGSLKGQLLFNAVYDSIDSSGTGSITKAQFREHFLVSKARELGLIELGESSSSAGDNGYDCDTFEESATPSTARIGEKTAVDSEHPATQNAAAKTQMPSLTDSVDDTTPDTAKKAADTSNSSSASVVAHEPNSGVQQQAAPNMTDSLPASAPLSMQPQRPSQALSPALLLPVSPAGAALNTSQADQRIDSLALHGMEETLPTEDAAMKTYLARLALADLIAATSLSTPPAPRAEVDRSADIPVVTAAWPAIESSEDRGLVQRSADDARIVNGEGPSSSKKRNGGRAVALSTGDSHGNVGRMAREELGREQTHMAGFDEVYLDFIQSIASGATGRNLRSSKEESRRSGGAFTKERRQLERAFADSLRECFSDPAIVSLVRRATHLRLKQQNRRSDK